MKFLRRQVRLISATFWRLAKRLVIFRRLKRGQELPRDLFARPKRAEHRSLKRMKFIRERAALARDYRSAKPARDTLRALI